MPGFKEQPFTLGPIERDKDSKMFIRCLLEQDGGRIEWLIRPSIDKRGAIHCSGVMGITGLSKRQAKAITAQHQQRVYRLCGQLFKAEIAKAQVLIVEAAA